MTLEQATEAVLAAIDAEDLEAVARAVTERGSALQAAADAGTEPTLGVIEKGQQACQALIALQQKWAFESARLSQFEAGFARSLEPAEPFCDFVG
jgi:hypothetical protein